MYNFKEIEKKWQAFWEENKTFKTENPNTPSAHSELPPHLRGINGEVKPKFYALDMFPYPSGAGLHVGHPEGYTANDIVARYKKAKGFNVLHPMGWDAFGLPAENYAIKTGTHPKITTAKNIETFKKQIKALGFSYDWDREIDTTNPKYYKWTQWIFAKMFEKGLAYEQDLPINFCPSCKTGLANEEVLNNGTCDRCGTQVEKRKIRQWVLAITKYADRLEKDVDTVDWPEGIKDMQKKWIGRSEGCEFEMKKAQDTKKGELPTSQGVEHNAQAKFSSGGIIFKDILKVKQKINFKGKLDINGYIDTEIGKINFNSENIIKHFSYKNTKELYYRQYLLATVFSVLDKIKFNENNIGYFIYKTLVIRVVLGKQTNGNYFVKSYYKYDKYTEMYQEYLNKDNLEKDAGKADRGIRVYTTRLDTVFGMTYTVIAPDHKDVLDFITPEQKEICEKYILEAKNKSDLDRTGTKEKTGVFTGSYVINPFNNDKVPVYIGDYVLGNYGTGAVMGVPAHDERDFEFAKKMGIEIKQSIAEYTILDGFSTPRKDKETLKRKTIDIILENDEGEFLLLVEKYGNNENIHFVGGGIEEGDTEIETVGKELSEETGYIDFEIIKPLNLSYSSVLLYRNTKDKNQYCIGRCFHLKLKSNKKIPSEIEEGRHTIKWVKKEEVNDNINHWMSNKKWWNIFINGEKAFTEDGILVNSGIFDGLTSSEAREKLTEYAEKQGFGTKINITNNKYYV